MIVINKLRYKLCELLDYDVIHLYDRTIRKPLGFSLFSILPLLSFFLLHLHFFVFLSIIGGAVAQSVERPTPGEEIPGSISTVAARSLLIGSDRPR